MSNIQNNDSYIFHEDSRQAAFSLKLHCVTVCFEASKDADAFYSGVDHPPDSRLSSHEKILHVRNG